MRARRCVCVCVCARTRACCMFQVMTFGIHISSQCVMHAIHISDQSSHHILYKLYTFQLITLFT